MVSVACVYIEPTMNAAIKLTADLESACITSGWTFTTQVAEIVQELRTAHRELKGSPRFDMAAALIYLRRMEIGQNIGADLKRCVLFATSGVRMISA